MSLYRPYARRENDPIMTRELATDHFRILALDRGEFLALRRDLEDFEEALDLSLAEGLLDDGVIARLEEAGAAVTAAGEDELPWTAPWALATLRDVVFGFLIFRGAPDETGTAALEIIAGEDWADRSAVAEIVSAIVDWAFGHDECRSLAATAGDSPGIPAVRGLESLGFRREGKGSGPGTFRLWKAIEGRLL